jgi:hypothetical protein
MSNVKDDLGAVKRSEPKNAPARRAVGWRFWTWHYLSTLALAGRS